MNGLSLFANVGIGETYLHKNNINIKVANELLEKDAISINTTIRKQTSFMETSVMTTYLKK